MNEKPIRAKAKARARIEYKVIRRDGSEEVVAEKFLEGKDAQGVWESIRHQFKEDEDNG